MDFGNISFRQIYFNTSGIKSQTYCYQGYLVFGFLSVLIGKSRVGPRSDRKSLEQKFKIIGKRNSPDMSTKFIDFGVKI